MQGLFENKSHTRGLLPGHPFNQHTRLLVFVLGVSDRASMAAAAALLWGGYVRRDYAQGKACGWHTEASLTGKYPFFLLIFSFFHLDLRVPITHPCSCPPSSLFFFLLLLIVFLSLSLSRPPSHSLLLFIFSLHVSVCCFFFLHLR